MTMTCWVQVLFYSCLGRVLNVSCVWMLVSCFRFGKCEATISLKSLFVAFNFISVFFYAGFSSLLFWLYPRLLGGIGCVQYSFFLLCVLECAMFSALFFIKFILSSWACLLGMLSDVVFIWPIVFMISRTSIWFVLFVFSISIFLLNFLPYFGPSP